MKPSEPGKATAQFLNEQQPGDILASTLIGQPAVNAQNETIGDVNDLVTDRDGKVIAALIGVGGFLGLGEKDVAVRFEDLKLTRDEDNNVKVMLDLNKDTLTSAPDYKLLNEQSVVEGSAKTDTRAPRPTSWWRKPLGGPGGGSRRRAFYLPRRGRRRDRR